MIDITGLIEFLQGTCMSLNDACIKFNITEDDLTVLDHAEIDNEIFCCETCGWWFEVSEKSEDDENCIGCHE